MMCLAQARLTELVCVATLCTRTVVGRCDSLILICIDSVSSDACVHSALAFSVVTSIYPG